MTTLSTTNGSEKPKVTLTCVQCRQRKRKCDKNNPCQSCVQSGFECTSVSRARLPRGRHVAAKEDSDLRQRVARLENLLLAQQSTGSGSGSSSEGSPSWFSVTKEVVGIRELLDQVTENEVEDDYVHVESAQSSDSGFEMMMFGDRSCYVQPEVLARPSEVMSAMLLDIYAQRVDPILKTIHLPTTRLALSANTGDLAHEALRFAIYFTAVTTLSEEECWHTFRAAKQVLRDKFQLAAEILMSRAGLMTTPNLTSLQAFVIHLTGIRAQRGCQAGSVAIATAIRIARILDLTKPARTLFQTELRRRVVLSITVLEVQAAFDSGSYSMLTDEIMTTAPPLHVNDADLFPEMTVLPAARQGFCDMTFASTSYEMMAHLRRMVYVPMDVDGKPLVVQGWAQRDATVNAFATKIRENHLQHCSRDVPFQRYMTAAGEGMIVVLRLLSRRPLYRFYSIGPPPSDDFDVLAVAMEELSHDSAKVATSDFAPWTWFGWNKWYALAVLLTELCEYTSGPLLDQAWVIAETSFEQYRIIMKDRSFWRSMEKLMRKARNVRHSFGAKITAPAVAAGSCVMPANSFDYDYNALDTAGDLASMPDMGSMNLWDNWESFVHDLNDNQYSMTLN